MILETERLIIRPLEEADRDAFAALHADPEVKRYFPGTSSRAEADKMFDTFRARYEQHGYFFMATVHKATNQMVGTIGLAPLRPEISDILEHPAATEIGWLLGANMWNQGLASEGARAWLDYGWNKLGLNEIVAFTVAQNYPSRRVMEKIGMQYECAFDHPSLPQDSPLRAHVNYRITRLQA